MFRRSSCLGFKVSCVRLLVQQDLTSIELPARDFYGSFSYDHLPTADVPDIGVKLFPFQKDGIGWMARSERLRMGGIMADHLGMGKTVQMIGLCLAADSIAVHSTLDEDVVAPHIGYRLLTVLRQLSKIAAVGSCTKLNRPAKEIHLIANDVEVKVRAGNFDFSGERGEVDKWLAFAARFHPVYEKRAHAFIDDAPCGPSFATTDAKVIRTLVVVPAALLLQWKSEIETKIRPNRGITVFVFHGKSKTASASQLENYDFVLTTYDTVAQAAARCTANEGDEVVGSFDRKKAGPLFEVVWRRIILDEAHVIRHAHTLRWRAILQLQGAKKWAVSATPLHNSINDLQNLLYFTGNARLPVFPTTQSQDILDDPVLQQTIAKSLQPIFLRRGPVVVRDGVREVLVELPEKHESVVTRALTPAECDSYNSILSQSRSVIDGKSNTTGHIFSLMTKLRLSCCHPWLGGTTGVQVFLCGICKCEASHCITTKCGHTFCHECLLQRFRDANDGDHEAARVPCPTCDAAVPSTALKKTFASPHQRLAAFKSRTLEPSTKLSMVVDAIKAMHEFHPGDKMIIFSHFTSFLDIIGLQLEAEQIEFLRLDGTMTLTTRNTVIRNFQSSGISVMIASKTATGVGLNLTAANHVVIVDPWWNPAIEEQAVHRCHRIGQKKAVHVSRFVIPDTIEHYCFEIAKKKKEFGDAILRAATANDAGSKTAANKLNELLSRLNYVGK